MILVVVSIVLLALYSLTRSVPNNRQGGCIAVGPIDPRPGHVGPQACPGNATQAQTTSAPQVASIKNNSGLIWNADQKTVNTQPDIAPGDNPFNQDIISQAYAATPFGGQPPGPVSPLLIWNPTDPQPSDLIGTASPLRISGGTSINTLPNPAPTTMQSNCNCTEGLSPSFWAADIVPQNPLLANGLSGPTLTQS